MLGAGVVAWQPNVLIQVENSDVLLAVNYDKKQIYDLLLQQTLKSTLPDLYAATSSV